LLSLRINTPSKKEYIDKIIVIYKAEISNKYKNMKLDNIRM